MGWRTPAKNWTGLSRRLFGPFGNVVRQIWDAPIFTIPIARERPEREQQLYGVRGFVPVVIGEFASVSLVSDTDVLIHRVRAHMHSTIVGLITAGASMAVFTPVVTAAGGVYTPFLNNAVTFIPQLRPRDDSFTLLVAGTNPTPFPLHPGSPGWGPLELQPVAGVGGLGITAEDADIYSASTGETPIFLPRGNLFTVQNTRIDHILDAGIWFEELQRPAIDP